MGLPPTSPRLKFVHTHPGGSPVPRRPPRHPPSPSTRSRSLELLDQDEKKSVLPTTEPEPLPRPRSRSLDGLLDEDGIVPEMKTEEASKQTEKNDDAEKPENLNRLLNNQTDQNSIASASMGAQNENVDKGSSTASSAQSRGCEERNFDAESSKYANPMPVPRLKTRVSTGAEPRMESAKIVQQEDTRISSSSEEASDKEEARPSRPPKPNRFASVDAQLPNTKKDDREDTRNSSGDIRPCDSNVELVTERLIMTGADKSKLLKAKSCGAGLDSDESISSNEYKPNAKGQGSLLSLPTGAEPKRKKNFMDKCVNKVRSFMRK